MPSTKYNVPCLSDAADKSADRQALCVKKKKNSRKDAKTQRARNSAGQATQINQEKKRRSGGNRIEICFICVRKRMARKDAKA